MIARFPALEAMQRLVGSYTAAPDEVFLCIAAVGYGQSIELRREQKVLLAGVIGARGNSIEFSAQMGLPNLITFSGSLEPEGSLHFVSQEPPVRLTIDPKPEGLTIGFWLHGEQRFGYALQRT